MSINWERSTLCCLVMEYLRKRLGREPQERPSPTPGSSTDEEEPVQDFEVIQEFVPIRFLENRIRTLSRTSVPHNLSRLEQHRENMVRLHAEKNWERLNAEQLNASRTVQQLKGHLQTLDELRQQVRPSDMSTFDQFTSHLRQDIQIAVRDYQALTASMQQPEGGERGGVARREEEEGGEDEQQRLLLVQKEALRYQSLEELRADLVELNDLVKHLNTTASEHSERVAKLSSRTESAAVRVQGGVADLRTTDRLKAYVLPVGGAIVGGVLGGVVGGPVGAVAGLKVGALTAATAGTAGVLGGAFIGYRVRKATANQTPNAATEQEEPRKDGAMPTDSDKKKD